MKQTLLILTVIFLLTNCSSDKSGEANEDSMLTAKVEDPNDANTVKGADELLGEVSITTSVVTMKDLLVSIEQSKPNLATSIYSCHSKISVHKDGKEVGSLNFPNIEAVGGEHGLTTPMIVHNHIILSKQGDYDGRTIIINERGQIFNIIGGTNFIDYESGLLFALYDSDGSGLAVFDLTSDSLLLSIDGIEDYPRSVHKAFGQRYFIKAASERSDELSIWEIELDMERIMQVDLDISEIDESNALEKIAVGEANCECKK